jgi:sulfate permease, SulP family
LKQYLPILAWLPAYKKDYLSKDLAAGLTVGVMLVPQGMAYAMIAGLPPVYGLYAAMIPQVIYALFGTSRQLAVGPVAMDSLLVAAAVTMLAEVGSDHYITLTILLAFMMGSIQLLLGLFRMGFLVNFLSKPVISGFTSAAALIIGLNQLKYLLGVDLARSNYIHQILSEAWQHLSSVNIIALAIGIGGIIILKNIKKLHKSIPGALVAVVLGILLVQFFHLDDAGVKIVGVVPEGLPAFTIPNLGSSNFKELIPAALTLALIAFMEAVSVAKAIQAKHKSEYEIDANQELVALGLGNVVGSFFGSFPTTGGFSRSAVNDQAGAKTNLAAIISALLVALTLLFLTPLFYYLPKAILASIIMVAVFGLIDIKYPKFLWQTRKEDFIMLLIAFAVTLGVGIKEGILLSVLISLIAMIYRSTKPHYAILGQFPDRKVFRNITRFDNLIVRRDILVIRYDADLYFANTAHFVDSVKTEIANKGPQLRLVVLQSNSIAHIDSSAYLALVDLIEELAQQNILFYFSDLIGPTRDFLTRAGIDDIATKEKSFVDVVTAISYFDEHFKQEKGAATTKPL